MRSAKAANSAYRGKERCKTNIPSNLYPKTYTMVMFSGRCEPKDTEGRVPQIRGVPYREFRVYEGVAYGFICIFRV